jgi:hypothetical protein
MEITIMTMQNNSLRDGNSDLDAIKGDIASLKCDGFYVKKDATCVARNLKENGSSVAREGMDQLRTAGERQYQSLESRIIDEPAKSVLMAFGAGLIVSFLLGSRR